jgi:hypothetical protein
MTWILAYWEREVVEKVRALAAAGRNIVRRDILMGAWVESVWRWVWAVIVVVVEGGLVNRRCDRDACNWGRRLGVLI